jgi:rod shape-determining protein MreC
MDSNNLTQSGYIVPVVDFAHLQEVLIITDKKKSGD